MALNNARGASVTLAIKVSSKLGKLAYSKSSENTCLASFRVCQRISLWTCSERISKDSGAEERLNLSRRTDPPLMGIKSF